MNGRDEKYAKHLSRKPEREEKMVELNVDYMILLKWIL
jgi:hypothetical protein